MGFPGAALEEFLLFLLSRSLKTLLVMLQWRQGERQGWFTHHSITHCWVMTCICLDE